MVIEHGRMLLREAYGGGRQKKGALYSYFHSYCTSGEGAEGGGMALAVELSNARFMKMISHAASGHLLSHGGGKSSGHRKSHAHGNPHHANRPTVTRADVDISFAKAKQKDRQTLKFPEFVQTLVLLGDKLYKGPRTQKANGKGPSLRRIRVSVFDAGVSKGGAGEGGREGDGEGGRAAAHDEKKEETAEPAARADSFTYRTFTGDDARLLKLVIENLFHGKRGSAEKLAHTTSVKQLQRRKKWAAGRIQRCYRGLLGRSLFEILKVQGEELKEKLRLERGVEVVQKLWRRRKARLRLLDLMKNVVKKYIDPDSGLPYWYNPMSGAVTWTKPKVGVRALGCLFASVALLRIASHRSAEKRRSEQSRVE